VPKRQSYREPAGDEGLGGGDNAHQPVDPRVGHPDAESPSGRMAAPVPAPQPRAQLLRERGEAVRVAGVPYHEAGRSEDRAEMTEPGATQLRVRAQHRNPARPEHAMQL
jgi:hypothetical protein